MTGGIETDVLVVGAGPTGLMLAGCLARLGVSVVIIDGKDGPTRESRALVLQARTMEIYDQLGLADRVLAAAELAPAIVPGFEKQHFRPVRFWGLGQGVTPYPELYVFEQSKNERLLVQNLRELGAEVLWGHGMVSLELSVDGAVCETSGGLSISARYVVGCDGSSSPVRTAVGVGFEGVTNEHTFYVVDAAGVNGLDLDSINLRFGESDFLLTFPMGSTDHQRLLGVVRDTSATEVSVRERLARVFAVTYGDSLWFSTYRVHHRVAERFRSGSVFLAGDAAHVHSPVGAQGMNTGLQDAHNLACKLADVFDGRAPDRYLDRFEAERRPVARRLVATTDTMFGVITSDRLLPRLARRRLVPLIAPIATRLVPRIGGSSRIFEYLSQTRIHYWMSEGAKSAAKGRRGKVVGRRLPWNGDNFESLRAMTWQVHGYGDVSPAAGAEVTVFPVVRNRRLRSGSYYLVRPDGFVAAIATDPADLRRSLPGAPPPDA